MDKIPRQIDILLFDSLDLLEFAGPVQAFISANEFGEESYTLRYVSIDGADVTTSCGLRLGVTASVTTGHGTQDLLVPGGSGVDKAMENQRIKSLIANWQIKGCDRRIISICSGALLLANAGILDGRSATTHWRRLPQARDQFPNVNWKIDQIYAIQGSLMTSAGVTSGIDLALEVIRRDCGPMVALSAARQLVVYLKRDGGQNQFSDLLEAQFSESKELGKLMADMLANPRKDWTLEAMADTVNLTPRTLVRRFSKTFGKSPHKFLERVRVKRAADAISSGAPVGKAIEVAGFSSFQQMQRAFKRQLGSTVGSYKERFCGFD